MRANRSRHVPRKNHVAGFPDETMRRASTWMCHILEKSAERLDMMRGWLRVFPNFGYTFRWIISQKKPFDVLTPPPLPPDFDAQYEKILVAKMLDYRSRDI